MRTLIFILALLGFITISPVHAEEPVCEGQSYDEWIGELLARFPESVSTQREKMEGGAILHIWVIMEVGEIIAVAELDACMVGWRRIGKFESTEEEKDEPTNTPPGLRV